MRQSRALFRGEIAATVAGAILLSALLYASASVGEATVAIGTLGLAVATVALALGTFGLVGTTAEEMELLRTEATALRASAEFAKETLNNSARQADLAEKSIGEARKQRYMSAVPLLRLEPDGISGGSASGSPFIRFALSNSGTQAALHVRARVSALRADMTPEDLELAHTPLFSVIASGDKETLFVTSEGLRKLAPARGTGLGPEFPLMAERFRVTLEFRGLLGARVWQEYDFFTRANNWRWTLHEFRSQPDPRDTTWLEAVPAEP